MKAISIIAIIAAVLFLVLAAIVYPIMNKYHKGEKATKIIGWISVACLALACVISIAVVIFNALK